MRQQRTGSTALLAALALTVLPEVSLAGQGPGDIVFVVSDYMNSGSVVSGTGQDMKIKTLIEPFAYIAHGALTALPEEDKIDLKEFERDYYGKDRQYKLVAAGKDVGTVKVRASAFDIQCVSLAASASASPSSFVSGMRMALATNAAVRDLGYIRRDATALEKGAFEGLVRGVYTRNSVKESIAAKAQTQSLTAIEGPAGVILVGSSMTTENVVQNTYDSNGQVAGTAPATVVNSVFLIAEKGADGRYHGSYSWFNSGSDNTFQSRNFVDVLGLDGDATPEIVTQFNYSEATEYHVYKRSDGKWVDYFKNEGSGC